MHETRAVKCATSGGTRILDDDQCFVEDWSMKKCGLHAPQHGAFDLSTEWSHAGIIKKWGDGTRKGTIAQNCYDWRWELEKCGWYHRIFRSLIYPKKHLFPCLANAFAITQKLESQQTGKNCALMLLNGIVSKEAGVDKSPHGQKLLKNMKHLNDDIIGSIWTVAYEFGFLTPHPDSV